MFKIKIKNVGKLFSFLSLLYGLFSFCSASSLNIGGMNTKHNDKETIRSLKRQLGIVQGQLGEA